MTSEKELLNAKIETLSGEKQDLSIKMMNFGSEVKEAKEKHSLSEEKIATLSETIEILKREKYNLEVQIKESADGKLIQVLVNMKKYKYSIYSDDTFNFPS